MNLPQALQTLNTCRRDIRTLMIEAGNAVMQIYNASEPIDVELKNDASPLTAADLASHEILSRGLTAVKASWPILSEESEPLDPKLRMTWPIFWLIDPLDGTKEFINRSDEFTINVALIFENDPIAGWVYAPATHELFEAVGERATLITDDKTTPIYTRALHTLAPKTPPQLLASRRHGTELMEQARTAFEALFGPCELISRGSSLKICELAAGRADFYPRLGPTHEWDTAAAHAVLKAAGGDILNLNNQPLTYNKKTTNVNPYFVAIADLNSPRHAQLFAQLNQLCANT